MVAMQDVDIQTEWSSSHGQSTLGSCLGPFLSSLTRTVGGMSLCQNIFTGGASGRGWVSLAPSFPGAAVKEERTALCLSLLFLVEERSAHSGWGLKFVFEGFRVEG